MHIDVLIAEMGSTTTLVNAFDDINSPKPVFWGQGTAPTSMEQGDVRIGLESAINNLKEKLSIQSKELAWDSFLATSSAAGGVDHGERDTALENAELIFNALSTFSFKIPVIYTGNIENQSEITKIFSNYKGKLIVTDNVYPRIDDLTTISARKIIQEVFEDHIINAPGMEDIRDIVDGSIVPTPGGVMLAAEILKEDIGDLLVVDVGGATTDIHSVTSGSEEINRILISPEPHAKRTVEGDLGIYINRKNVLQLLLQHNNDTGLNSGQLKKKILTIILISFSQYPLYTVKQE